MSETKYCINCGAEIDEKAVICPKCGVQQSDEKNTTKVTLWNVIGWIIGVFFGIGGISMIVLGTTMAGIPLIIASFIMIPPVMKWIERKANIKLSGGLKVVLVIVLFFIYAIFVPTIPTTYNTDDKNGFKEPISTPKSYGIEDRVISNDIAFTVNNVYTTPYIGSEFFGSSADGIFVVIEMTIENTGKETKHIMQSFTKIVDSEGRVFDPDEEAWIYLEDNIVFEQLQPGLSTSGRVVFDVPKDTYVNLRVSGSMWETNTKTISLGRT